MSNAYGLVDPDILSATRVRDQLARAGWRRAAAGEAPAAVVLNLAGGDVASAVRAATARWPGAALIGFCGHADRDRRNTALAAGCHAVLTHGEAMTNLVPALRRILDVARDG